jgi:hypothetical protein
VRSGTRGAGSLPLALAVVTALAAAICAPAAAHAKTAPPARRSAPENMVWIPGGVARNPKGPADSVDPAQPGVAKRVQKGGSFLCTDQYCARYMPGGRGKGEPDTGTNHTGFRCVRDPEPAAPVE